MEEQLETSHKRIATVVELENEILKYKEHIQELSQVNTCKIDPQLSDSLLFRPLHYPDLSHVPQVLTKQCQLYHTYLHLSKA